MEESSEQFTAYLFLKIFSPASSLENKECVTGLRALLEPLEARGGPGKALTDLLVVPGLTQGRGAAGRGSEFCSVPSESEQNEAVLPEPLLHFLLRLSPVLSTT